MSKKNPDSISDNEKIFCQEYVIDFNARRAYQKIKPNVKDGSASVEGYKLLRKPYVQEYLAELKQELAEYSGITKERVLNEYAKMAFTDISDLHNTWVTRKDFEELTREQKGAIAEIQTRVRKTGKGDEEVEEVKIKLHDKKGALDSIAKMLGFNEADKLNVSGDGIEIIFPKK